MDILVLIIVVLIIGFFCIIEGLNNDIRMRIVEYIVQGEPAIVNAEFIDKDIGVLVPNGKYTVLHLMNVQMINNNYAMLVHR